MDRIRAGNLYIFIADFRVDYAPLFYEAKKGDVVRADDRSWGYVHFYHTGRRRRNQREYPEILMTPKEAFKCLKEYKGKKVITI